MNRKYVSKCLEGARGKIGKKLSLNEAYVKNSILFLKQILEALKEQVTQKYSKYNKEYLMHLC